MYQHFNQGDDLPDTTELVQLQLQQLQAALRSPQRKITWCVHQPMGRAEIEKRIKTLKMTNLVSSIFNIGLVFYLANTFADDAVFRNGFLVLMGLMLAGYTYIINVYLPPKMRQNRINTINMTLNLDKQNVVIGDNKQQRKVKFHSHESLPAFILPAQADADLCRLCDEVQRHITQITGLRFAV